MDNYLQTLQRSNPEDTYFDEICKYMVKTHLYIQSEVNLFKDPKLSDPIFHSFTYKFKYFYGSTKVSPTC